MGRGERGGGKGGTGECRAGGRQDQLQHQLGQDGNGEGQRGASVAGGVVCRTRDQVARCMFRGDQASLLAEPCFSLMNQSEAMQSD